MFGRGSVCINSGGEKIFPEEVEAALKAHPEVVDAVVVGIPDERWGQRVAALVQPRAAAIAAASSVDAHCRTHIAGYKVPQRSVRFVDKVQRQPSGKPDYRGREYAPAAAAATGRVDARPRHAPGGRYADVRTTALLVERDGTWSSSSP